MSITFRPDPCKLGPIGAGQTALAQVLVTSRGASEVPVAIEGGGGPFSIVSEARSVPAGGELEIFIEYAPAAVGTHSATLEAGGARLPLRGEAVEPFDLSPRAIDFGSVTVGGSRVATVSVTNATGADLTLSLVHHGGAVSAQPGVVPSTGVATLVVLTFRPSATGPLPTAAALSFLGRSEGVALQGVGVQPSLAGAAGSSTPAGTTEAGVSKQIQRFYLKVPAPESELYLGKGLDGMKLTGMKEARRIDGCGLDTAENVVLRARGTSPTKGRLWAEANKAVVIHSTAKESFVQVHAHGEGSKAILSSAGGSYVSGEGGVVINGGLDLGRKVPDKDSGFEHTPDTDRIDSFIKGFTYVDVAVATGMAGLALKSVVDDWGSSGKIKRTLEVLGTMGALAAPVMGTLGAEGKVPGVSVYGHAAVSLFTPGFGAFYGVTGLGLISLFPTMVGLIDANVVAMDDIGLRAFKGHVNIDSGKAVHVNASEYVRIEASSKGHLQGGFVGVYGGKIRIGARHDRGRLGDVAYADEVSIGGATATVRANKALDLGVGVGHPKGNARIEMSPTGIELHVGTNYIKITSDGIAIGTAGEASLLSVTPTLISLDSPRVAAIAKTQLLLRGAEKAQTHTAAGIDVGGKIVAT